MNWKKKNEEVERLCSKRLSTHVNKQHRTIDDDEHLRETQREKKRKRDRESKGVHARARSILINRQVEVLLRSMYLHRCPENTILRMRVNFRSQGLPFLYRTSINIYSSFFLIFIARLLLGLFLCVSLSLSISLSERDTSASV